MRRICVLVIGMLFLMGGSKASAILNPGPHEQSINTIQGQSSVEETFYNKYGVARVGLSTTTTRTITTATDPETGQVTSSTTTTQSQALSTWKAGSLKINETEGRSFTGARDSSLDNMAHNTDGSYSVTEFGTRYVYNANGQLENAVGTEEGGFSATTTGYRGEDAGGQSTGRFESYTTDTYQIRNGQALVISSTVNGQTHSGVNDALVSISSATTNRDYAALGGSWVVMSEGETSTATALRGTEERGKTHLVKTTTYNRDGNGKITGMSSSVNPEASYRIDERGVDGLLQQNLGEYVATYAFASDLGWYLSYEKLAWIDEGGISQDTEIINNPPAPAPPLW